MYYCFAELCLFIEHISQVSDGAYVPIVESSKFIFIMLSPLWKNLPLYLNNIVSRLVKTDQCFLEEVFLENRLCIFAQHFAFISSKIKDSSFKQT